MLHVIQAFVVAVLGYQLVVLTALHYLTFVISAEVGVLVRWLSTGMREPVGIVARMMTAMLFVRPGDLYGRPIGFDIPSIAPQFVSQRKELLNGSDN